MNNRIEIVMDETATVSLGSLWLDDPPHAEISFTSERQRLSVHMQINGDPNAVADALRRIVEEIEGESRKHRGLT